MSGVAAAVEKRIYKIGSSGPRVTTIQLGLRDLGFGLKGTSYYGNATYTAVRAFQQRAGLDVDGAVGPSTAKALDAALDRLGKVLDTAAGQVARQEIARPLWHLAGLALIGTKEYPGSADNQVIIDWAKDEGGDIAKSYTHDSIPWCALFQNHLLTKVGLPGTETLWALDFAGKWPCVRLDGPAVGAFAPMLRDGGGHVTNVAGRTKSGLIAGLGGNQHDAVNIADFAISRLNKGFWWPADVPLPALVGFAHLPIVDSSGRISANEA